jgi:uncharacterized protein YndB with AHSA1/START domain
MISQTAHFVGLTPDALYDAYLSSKVHSAMTANARPATFFRSHVGEVPNGAEHDELRAFGFPGPDGKIHFFLKAQILQLIPKKKIVLSWKNQSWNLAVDQKEVTDLPSTVVLSFRTNAEGAEIQLVQADVPDYKVKIPASGEVGPLSTLVNTHWNVLYWEPMRRYFQKA